MSEGAWRPPHGWPFNPLLAKQFLVHARNHARRTLLRWVQIALKPASKALGLHGVFIGGKGLKYLIADSAFKRMQIDARARAGSMLTSIIWALHLGQTGRSIAANGMADDRR
jgi:hypothetical protein